MMTSIFIINIDFYPINSIPFYRESILLNGRVSIHVSCYFYDTKMIMLPWRLKNMPHHSKSKTTDIIYLFSTLFGVAVTILEPNILYNLVITKDDSD